MFRKLLKILLCAGAGLFAVIVASACGASTPDRRVPRSSANPSLTGPTCSTATAMWPPMGPTGRASMPRPTTLADCRAEGRERDRFASAWASSMALAADDPADGGALLAPDDPFRAELAKLERRNRAVLVALNACR